MARVFVTASLPGKGLDKLSEGFEVEVFPEDRSITHNELMEGAKEADALITLLTDRVDREVINSSTNLRIIANCAVGYDNIDLQYATGRGIFVTNTPGILTETTADLAWALIMSVARWTPRGDAFVREGKFKVWRPKLFLGMDVHGKTLGIYGMGRIGEAVARRAEGFNMRVIYYNRKRNEQGERDTGAIYVDFPTLLKESDFLVITAPLNKESEGRFGWKEFKEMKRGSILVNVGRGPIVREKELARALKERVIWGAGLDVYEREPEIEKGLLALENVVLLPHLGSASFDTREQMADMAVRNVIAALNGEIPPNLVNKEVLKLLTLVL